MIELRWNNGELEYRQRAFQVDASGAFCGVTDHGDWQIVPTAPDTAATAAVEALGWMHAELCRRLDAGEDPREVEVPELLEKAIRDLGVDNDAPSDLLAKGVAKGAGWALAAVTHAVDKGIDPHKIDPEKLLASAFKELGI